MIALRNVYSAEYRFPDLLMTGNKILGDLLLFDSTSKSIRTSRLVRFKTTDKQRLKIFWLVPLSPPPLPHSSCKAKAYILIWMRHHEEGSDTLSGVLCHGSDYDKVAPNIHVY